jgi:predicted nucleic acid-binding protein
VVTRTFLDTGILIAAARGTGSMAVRAHSILDDPTRTFTTSDYIRLELFPKAIYEQRTLEVRFYTRFFAQVVQMVPYSLALAQQAYAEACACGLAAMDALHIAAAKQSNAAEFITTERATKPLFRVTGIRITTINPLL